MKRQLLGLLLGLFAATGLVVAGTAIPAGQAKTTICHRTKAAKKPYIKITVSKSVLKGHLKHPADIIPAPGGVCPTVVLTPTQGGVLLTANLLGSNEVPAGTGDPNGTGTAQVRLRAGEGRLCFSFSAITNTTLPATAAHIHIGAAGTEPANNIVVTLTAPDADGNVEGCVNVARSLVSAILANPSGFYVNVHTTDFPDGAIRGQL